MDKKVANRLMKAGIKPLSTEDEVRVGEYAQAIVDAIKSEQKEEDSNLTFSLAALAKVTAAFLGTAPNEEYHMAGFAFFMSRLGGTVSISSDDDDEDEEGTIH